MPRKKVLTVFGTRPEAIKMAPVVHALSRRTEAFDSRILVTGQHREMLDQVLAFFRIRPDWDLELMRAGQTPSEITEGVLRGMQPVLREFQPDWVLVHGDTTTSTSAALAAYYQKISVGHVEAGLRTSNKYSPYPEEMNRRLTGCLADLHFAPTATARQNLLGEAVPTSNIVVTGNTVIDALFWSLEEIEKRRPENVEMLQDTLSLRGLGACRIILVTAHRRESFGEPLRKIFLTLKRIAAEHPDVGIVYPVHPNPNVLEPAREILGDIRNVALIEPLSYEAFVWMMSRSELIVTDSGGVQEEAPSLGKPVLLIRDTSERPEAIRSGCVELVGTDPGRVYDSVSRRLAQGRPAAGDSPRNPYGDGRAANRIVDYLANGACEPWMA